MNPRSFLFSGLFFFHSPFSGFWAWGLTPGCTSGWDDGSQHYSDFRFSGFGTEAIFLSILVPTRRFLLSASYLWNSYFHDFRYRGVDCKKLRLWALLKLDISLMFFRKPRMFFRKPYFLKDVSVLKTSFCTEFFAASFAVRARHTTLTLFYGRNLYKNTILYLPPWFSVQQLLYSTHHGTPSSEGAHPSLSIS